MRICDEAPEFEAWKARNSAVIEPLVSRTSICQSQILTYSGKAKQRIPQLRGAVRTVARQQVCEVFKIDSGTMTKEDIKDLVRSLLDKSAFTFGDPTKVSGP